MTRSGWCSRRWRSGGARSGRPARRFVLRRRLRVGVSVVVRGKSTRRARADPDRGGPARSAARRSGLSRASDPPDGPSARADSSAACGASDSMATAAASCCSCCSRSISIGATSGLVLGAAAIPAHGDQRWGWVVHLFFLYSMLALGDLLRHVWRVERALERGTLADGREAIARLVGRDTDRMDAGACRRAAVESLSESLTDGFTSPLFWYVLLGLPGRRAVQSRQHDGFDGRLQDAALPALRLVRRARGRRDELRAGAAHVAADRADRGDDPRLLHAEGPPHRLDPARDPARPELRMERSRHRRRAPAPHRRPDLVERRDEDGRVDWRSRRSAGRDAHSTCCARCCWSRSPPLAATMLAAVTLIVI